MDPKEYQLPQEPMWGRGGRLKVSCLLEGGLSPSQEEIPHSSDSLSNHPAEETMVGQQWEGPGLEQDDLL